MKISNITKESMTFKVARKFLLLFMYQANDNLRLIRSIRSSLSEAEAVEARVDAAGHESDVSRQQTLLRAASYGHAFCRLVCSIISSV